MKTLALSLAAIAVASLTLVAVSTSQTAPPVSLRPGDKAPDLKLRASDGQQYELAQFRGVKAVAVCWFPLAGSQGAKNQCAALEAAMPQIPRDKLQVFGCSTADLDATTAYLLTTTMNACTHDVSILLAMLSVPKCNMFTGKPILDKGASQIWGDSKTSLPQGLGDRKPFN